MGAKVTGIDISGKSIETAKKLADKIDSDAEFFQSNVYDIEQVLDQPFDIVYTSYGVLNWLDDLKEWGRLIRKFLKPDGFFFMVEFHPAIYMLDDQQQLTYSYFKQDAIVSKVVGSYTDGAEKIESEQVFVEWHHSLAEIFQAFLCNKMQIVSFEEYPFSVYNCFKNMEELEPGEYVFEGLKDHLPHMFSMAVRELNSF